MPPNPNELLSAFRTVRSRASWGTRSIPAVAVFGIVEVQGGRHEIVLDRENGVDRLDASRGAEEVADRRFRRGHADPGDRVAEQAPDGADLDLVTDRGRGAVGVDVVDVAGLDSRVLHRRAHGPVAAVAVRRRRGDVVGIPGKTVAENLRIDPGAALSGVPEFLEHDDAGALPHDESVASPVPGPRGAFGLVVVVRGERARSREPGDPERTDRRLGAARDHDVRVVMGNEARGVADGMGSRRTGRDDRVVRSPETEPDGNMARGKVDQGRGDEERADPARPPVPEEEGGVLDRLEAADAGADQHARALLFSVFGRLPAGVPDRLLGGGDGIDDEIVHAPLFLGIDVAVRVEGALGAAARRLAGDLRGKVVDGKVLDGANPRPARRDLRPVVDDPVAQRGHHAEAGDDDPARSA